MTTIATDGRSMAGDGLVHDHRDVIVGTDRRKVFRLTDGRIVGGAGNSFDVSAWIAWLEAGKEGPCPIDSDRFAGLILQPDGVVLWVDHKGREERSDPPCAVGSGCEFALGAMHARRKPVQAVSIACKLDLYSGGRIITEYLDGGA